MGDTNEDKVGKRIAGLFGEDCTFTKDNRAFVPRVRQLGEIPVVENPLHISVHAPGGYTTTFCGRGIERMSHIATLLELRPHTAAPDIDMAARLARKRHEGQMWGPVPYKDHLNAVARIVQNETEPTRGLVRELVCAAFLHDIVEDTETTLDEVRFLFGDRVAELVGLVTNPPGGNRASRHEVSYPKIRQDPDAIVLKLADRLVNVIGPKSGEKNEHMRKLYRKEHPRFRELLHRGSECSTPERNLWRTLDFAVENPSSLESR